MKSLIIPAFFITLLTAQAQSPEVDWMNSYGGTGYDYLYSVMPLEEGGFLACGSISTGGGVSDGLVVKTDAAGDTIWTAAHGHSEHSERFHAMTGTADSGFIFTGTQYDVNNQHNNCYLVKVDSDGELDWSTVFGAAPASASPTSVTQTYDGGYVLAGHFYDDDLPSHYAGFVVKTDPTGLPTQWHIMDWEWGDTADYVIETADSNLVVVGSTNSFENHYYQALLVKLDPMLTPLWTQTYGGDMDEYGYHVLETEDGGLLISGAQQQIQDALNSNDFFLVKTDAGGAEEWSTTCGDQHNDVAHFTTLHPESGYVTCGSGAYPGGSFDMYVVHVDEGGELVWQDHYGMDGMEIAYCIRSLEDSGYILAGITNSYGAGLTDGNLIRLTADGEYVVPEVRKSIPDRTLMVRNYPNPFNGATTIEYTMQRAAEVEIALFNSFGELVAHFREGYRQPGQHQLSFNPDRLSSGVYFYQLNADGLRKTGRLVYLK